MPSCLQCCGVCGGQKKIEMEENALPLNSAQLSSTRRRRRTWRTITIDITMPAGFGGCVCPTTSTHSLTHTRSMALRSSFYSIQNQCTILKGNKQINCSSAHFTQSEIEIVGRAVWNTAPIFEKDTHTRGRRVGQRRRRRRRTRSLSMWHTLKRSQTKRRNFDGTE